MTRTYPAYMTVIWCMVVALVVGFGGYDVGRRLGANAVRQEAIRAGAAKVERTALRDSLIDRTRTEWVMEFQWINPDAIRASADSSVARQAALIAHEFDAIRSCAAVE